MTRLMTAQQVADTFGLPSPATLRTMRQNGLPAVRLGKAFLFDHDDVIAFIERQKTCLDRTREHPLSGSRSGDAGISGGMSKAAQESAP